MSAESSSPQTGPNPFKDPEHSEVLASRDVSERGARIVVVAHHENGRWGFYSDRGGRGVEDVVTVIFDKLLESGPDLPLAALRSLKKGETAIRAGEGMNEHWIFPDEEKKKQPRGGCLGVLLLVALGATLVFAILASVFRSSS